MSNLLQGLALIGGQPVRGNGAAFQAFDPARNEALGPDFNAVDAAQVNAACALAGAAFDAYRATGDHERAAFLDQIAAQILALGDDLILRAMAETGLPRARLEGERGRTVNQLKLFAELLREGSWQDARIDSALPTRTPPRPDLRLRFVGVGPVAVFGASNFPLAFSVAGGDTAAALAAGCPVVVKAHSAHPGTSELVGRAVVEAVKLSQLPAGVFALLTGSGHGIGGFLHVGEAVGRTAHEAVYGFRRRVIDLGRDIHQHHGGGERLVRFPHRQHRRDAAKGGPDQGCRTAQRGQHRAQIGRVIIDRVMRLGRPVALAVAALIKGDDIKAVVGQGLRRIAPGEARLPAAVQQDGQWISGVAPHIGGELEAFVADELSGMHGKSTGWCWEAPPRYEDSYDNGPINPFRPAMARVYAGQPEDGRRSRACVSTHLGVVLSGAILARPLEPVPAPLGASGTGLRRQCRRRVQLPGAPSVDMHMPGAIRTPFPCHATRSFPMFLAMNRFGQIPVLDDGGTIVSDSNAILVYAALKYERSDWLPREPAAAAEVQRAHGYPLRPFVTMRPPVSAILPLGLSLACSKPMATDVALSLPWGLALKSSSPSV